MIVRLGPNIDQKGYWNDSKLFKFTMYWTAVVIRYRQISLMSQSNQTVLVLFPSSPIGI